MRQCWSVREKAWLTQETSDDVSNLFYLDFPMISFLQTKGPVVFTEPGPGILEQDPSTHILTFMRFKHVLCCCYDNRVFQFSGMHSSEGGFLRHFSLCPLPLDNSVSIVLWELYFPRVVSCQDSSEQDLVSALFRWAQIDLKWIFTSLKIPHLKDCLYKPFLKFLIFLRELRLHDVVTCDWILAPEALGSGISTGSEGNLGQKYDLLGEVFYHQNCHCMVIIKSSPTLIGFIIFLICL